MTDQPTNLIPLVDEKEKKMKNPTRDVVTVDRELFNSMLDDQEFLRCLEECGVDNWEGYEDAQAKFVGAD